jgi:hypothetical protein
MTYKNKLYPWCIIRQLPNMLAFHSLPPAESQ